MLQSCSTLRCRSGRIQLPAFQETTMRGNENTSLRESLQGCRFGTCNAAPSFIHIHVINNDCTPRVYIEANSRNLRNIAGLPTPLRSFRVPGFFRVFTVFIDLEITLDLSWVRILMVYTTGVRLLVHPQEQRTQLLFPCKCAMSLSMYLLQLDSITGNYMASVYICAASQPLRWLCLLHPAE